MANGIHQWRTHQAMHRSFRQQPYVAWHPSSSSAALRRPSILARAAQGGTKAKETLHTLDALLGQTVPSHSPNQVQDDSDDEHEWWTLQPKQSAPPRQVATSPGTGTGRFILNEDLLQLAEMRVGSKTSLDGQLELPKVQPVISFVLLLLNLSVYGTYVNVGTLQGPDAAMDFLSGLWMQPILLLHDPPFIQVIHAITASVMAPGPVELVVTLWALAMVAPRAESVMGYIPFMSIYMLSGVTGTLAQLFSMADGRYSPDSLGACGASAAIMGVLGCLAVHHLVNREVEAEAAGWRDTSTSSSSYNRGRPTPSPRLRAPSPEPPTYPTPSPSPRSSSPEPFSSLRESSPGPSYREPSPGISYRQQSPEHAPPTPTTSSSTPTRQQAGQRLLLVQSVCVAAVSLGVAGMQMLQGHPSDAGGGAGLWGEVAVGVGVLPQMAGLGAGVLLGLGMGPQYALQREVDIPEGSMVVPEDAEEMVVVLDRRTNWQQITTGVMYSGALVVMLLSAGNA